MKSFSQTSRLFCSLGVVGLLVGCSAQQSKKAADGEVYAILQKAEKHVFGKKTDFTIDTKYSARQPKHVKASELLDKSQSGGSRSMSIDDAINYAVRNSREYQSQRERLYLTALNLSSSKHRFNPQFGAGVDPFVARDSNGDQRGGVGTSGRLSQSLITGGNYSLSLANDLLKYFTGDPRRSASSVVSLNILQPLLSGAGKKIAAEQLTQANRNVVYGLRDYNQFQDEFSREIVVQYLRLLQQKESVKNQLTNYEARQSNAEYLRARAVDRASPQEVSDAEQDELQSKTSWINAKARYQTSLDDFKLTLGMPTTVKLSLVDNELDKIANSGLKTVSLTTRQSFNLALKNRLPLLNEIDRFEDQKRQVVIAADALKADINLVGSASLRSTGNSYEKFNFDRVSSQVGLELNLPINKKIERNGYRSSLIQFESSIRGLSRTYDSLQNLMEQRHRQLRQFQQNYEIQKGAVELAKKRVEANKMRLQAGTLIFRRLSESQDSLIQAQNAVTDALVDYQQARLQLFTDIGILNTEDRSYWLKSNPTTR